MSSLHTCVKPVYLHSVGVVREVGALQKWQARVGVKSVYLCQVCVLTQCRCRQGSGCPTEMAGAGRR